MSAKHDGFAAVRPDGTIAPASYALTKKGAKDTFLGMGWDQYRRAGWKIIRVKLVAADPPRRQR